VGGRVDVRDRVAVEHHANELGRLPALPRTLGGSVSRPSPLSTVKRIGWNDLSAVMSVEIGREQLTDTPSFTGGRHGAASRA
jgi:hypothetical protein